MGYVGAMLGSIRAIRQGLVTAIRRPGDLDLVTQAPCAPLARAADASSDPNFLFIGGLHRSGTSLIHRLLRAHPDAAGFHDTQVPEDEGQHLQDVFPPALVHGGPGRFAFDPAARLTERSPLLTPENRARLLDQWGTHGDLNAAVFLEKSPPNLIRMRFFRTMFPAARFLVIVRHPIPVAYATRKMSQTTVAETIFHWCVAHAICLEDLRRVGSVAILRYEDFVTDPETRLAALQRFAGLSRQAPAETVTDSNAAYFAQWEAHDGIEREIMTALPNYPLRLFGYRLVRPYVEPRWHAAKLHMPAYPFRLLKRSLRGRRLS